jgi:cell pole-organizing protein PopZ
MEEILASIRRIISEDEASTEQPPRSASASQEDDEHLELVEGEADDKIIHDIARVLSGGAPGPVEEPAEESAAEDILDLTAELGGLEPVETLELVEELDIAEFQPDEPALELEPEPEPMALEAEVALEPEPAPPVQMAPPPPPAPVSMEPPQRKLSASEEAASALERAIAALRAGQVPTSAPPPTPNYMSASGPAPQPAPPPPLFGAERHTTPEFMPEPAPVPGFIPLQLDSAPAPEAELELVLTEFEVETTETLVVEVVPVEELSAEPEGTMSTPDYESDYMSRLTNGSGPHEDLLGASGLPAGSTQAIEESIKDILRPMLQQWLDENMARVVTAALKDEIRSDPARFQRD